MVARSASFPVGEVKQSVRPWLEAMVAAIDDRLRRRQGVFEYSDNPDCVFRIALVAANRDYTLADGVKVRVGDRLISLHLWNEQFPAFPENGLTTLGWARRVGRGFEISLRQLARFLATRRDLDDVVAVCGTMAFGVAPRDARDAGFAGCFGFERVATPVPLTLTQRLHRLGENILLTMLVLARNAAALRADTLRRDRMVVILSRRKLLERYGSARRRTA